MINCRFIDVPNAGADQETVLYAFYDILMAFGGSINGARGRCVIYSIGDGEYYLYVLYG